MITFTVVCNLLEARAKIGVCIIFYWNKIVQTEYSLIRPFCGEKHFTAAAHFKVEWKAYKVSLMVLCIISFNFKTRTMN